MIIPDACSLPAWPRATRRRNWVVVAEQAGTAWWYGLNHYAPNRHDTGSTSPRSVGEVALIRHHYKPLFACVDRTFVKSISSRRRPEKKERIAQRVHGIYIRQSTMGQVRFNQ